MKKRFNYAWIVALMCFLMFFVVPGAGMASLSLYVLPISTALGIANSAFSVIISIAAIGIFIFSMLFGFLQKKIGLKKMITIGLSLSVVAMLMFAFSKSLVMYYIAALLTGIGYVAGTATMCSTIITSWFVKRQGLILGIIFTAPNFGAMLFYPLIGSWIEKLGYSNSFLLCAGAMLITMIIVSIFIRVHPSDMGQLPYGAEEAKTEATKQEKELSGPTFSQAFKTANFWLLIFTALLLGLAMPAFQSIMPVFLGETGFDLIFVGTVLGAAALFSSFSDIIMGLINDKFGILITNAFGCGCFILSAVFLLFGKSEIFIWISAVLLGIGLAEVSLPIPLMVEKIFGKKAFSTIMGIVFGLTFLGFAIGTPLGNLINEATGKFEYAFMIQITMTALAFLFSTIALKKKLIIKRIQPVQPNASSSQASNGDITA
ncbi:MAG: MFS transporter [Bacillota bacterium]